MSPCRQFVPSMADIAAMLPAPKACAGVMRKRKHPMVRSSVVESDIAMFVYCTLKLDVERLRFDRESMQGRGEADSKDCCTALALMQNVIIDGFHANDLRERFKKFFCLNAVRRRRNKCDD